MTTFRDALWRLLWTDASPDGDDVETPEVFANESAARALARALAQLHDRSGRMRLVAPELFHAPELFRGGGEGNTASVDAFLSEVSCGMVASGARKRRRRRTRARGSFFVAGLRSFRLTLACVGSPRARGRAIAPKTRVAGARWKPSGSSRSITSR